MDQPVNDDTSATGTPSQHREPRAFMRYVAIGDSFTEGMSDADPDRTGKNRPQCPGIGWG